MKSLRYNRFYANAEDMIVGPDAAADLHRRVAGSQLHLYEGLGHAAFEEAPDFNDCVFGFLDAGTWK